MKIWEIFPIRREKWVEREALIERTPFYGLQARPLDVVA
jgi:hypothetical protein